MRSGMNSLAIVVVVMSAVFSPLLMSAVEASSDDANTALQPEFLVVRVEVSGPAEIEFLSRWLDIWDADPQKGVVVAAVDDEGIAVLRDFGFQYEIDAERTEKYNRPPSYLKDQTEGIPGYPCYRTVEETHADGAALAAAYPNLAEWIDIGDSWEKTEPGGGAGYDLLMLRLTNTTNGIPSADKPRLWVMGSTHARELVTAETVTRFAEHLLANYGVDPDVTWVLDHHELHLLLVTNPDGRKKAEQLLSWRKNTNENYCGATSNDRGADLNRNFDFYWGCCGGSSGDPCSTTYRGPSAASEPETQAVRDWLIANFPDWRDDDLVTPAPNHATGIFIDVHSSGGDVFTAFGFQDPPPPNDAQFLRLGRKFSFFTWYDAKLGSGYPVDGSTKDFGYGRLGMPGYTVELGTEFFEECSYFEPHIYPQNLQALLFAARAVRAPYTQSSGPEVVAPTALPSTPNMGETVSITATIDDSRYGPGESSPPISLENIAAAEIYIDIPPWQAGAVAIALDPVDGSFDSSVEAVIGYFPSAGLSIGRHTVYIRGQDTAGYWGTVRAVFVWILDPGTSAHISGMLTDAVSGLPLQGSVNAGLYSAPSGPATGSYDLLVPAGTYDVTASAPGHYDSTMSGVVAIEGDTTLIDFELEPLERALFDDVESGNIGWTADPPWDIVSNQSHSPVSSWHESPGGDSLDGANISLVAPPVDLSTSTGVNLVFWHRYAFESGFDYGLVEWSSDGGLSWHQAASYTGTLSSWSRVEIALPGLDGASAARIRFRYTSDAHTNFDGWYIDDISLEGIIEEEPLFSDDFESGSTFAWSVTTP